ncbi:MAG: OmpH family outer membrane protein [Proteobacteria bacterium]|nr:MAG: OmpH family outer membrane protein [Pseudomonadota bacterium]TDJ73061.1 MAG: OmpH family outer membrane protein [Pseudomonadota bacterium]
METRAFWYKLFGVLLVFIFLLSANVVSAQGIKIGYVNAVKVIEEAPQGEAALKKLESEFGPRDKRLVSMQNDIRELEDDLEKNGLIMTDADRRAKEREILVMKRNLRRATQEFREDYNLRRNEELAVLQKIVKKAILEIAKQEKYDLIVHEGTIYASSKIDITDKVLEKLNKKSE